MLFLLPFHSTYYAPVTQIDAFIALLIIITTIYYLTEEENEMI